jgi:glycosyltransferase involved in cell wall biosynthesis
MKAAILFDNFGPYHLARLQAAAGQLNLLAIEVAQQSGEYAWVRPAGADRLQTVSLFSGVSRVVGARAMFSRLADVLDEFKPDAVFVPGWSSRAALAALHWCLCRRVPAVVMSESTAWDEVRSPVKEWLKRQIIRGFAAGLAGGTPHADYLTQLGLPRERIFLGYDAVDNDYFAAGVAESREQGTKSREKHQLPEKYFLASARFVEKKNLARLLQAYALYRQNAEKLKATTPASDSGPPSSVPWDLVLLGDGPLRADLCRLIADLGLQQSVQLPGFKQYPDLPAYYAGAGAFIHASTTEQWGLVVNEAMASGLPVLVSNRCGCARDLVQDGVNGFTFDPYEVDQMAQIMFQVSGLGPQLSGFGSQSQRLISEWGPQRFAVGVAAAARAAMTAPIRPPWLTRWVLAALRARS